MKQIEDKPKEQEVKRPGLPVLIPTHIVRWAAYSVMFMLLAIPFVDDTRQLACAGLILGHFASQLNALINKK